MSILTAAFIFERYGPRLSVDKLAEALDIAKGTIYNGISAETFAVPTYLDGGKRYADYRDVAAHIDACRERAKAS